MAFWISTAQRVRVLRNGRAGYGLRAALIGRDGLQSRVSQFQRIRLARFLVASPGFHSRLRFGNDELRFAPQAPAPRRRYGRRRSVHAARRVAILKFLARKLPKWQAPERSCSFDALPPTSSATRASAGRGRPARVGAIRSPARSSCLGGAPLMRWAFMMIRLAAAYARVPPMDSGDEPLPMDGAVALLEPGKPPLLARTSWWSEMDFEPEISLAVLPNTQSELPFG